MAPRQVTKARNSVRAVAILREHAGTQWYERIVEAVARVTVHEAVGVFADVGHVDHDPCGCSDALPESVQALLV